MNYDPNYSEKELFHYEEGQKKYDFINGKCKKIFDDINSYVSIRTLIVSKQQTEPSYVAEKYAMMSNTLAIRDICKKKSVKFKQWLIKTYPRF